MDRPPKATACDYFGCALVLIIAILIAVGISLWAMGKW